jgi:hypothetical protein
MIGLFYLHYNLSSLKHKCVCPGRRSTINYFLPISNTKVERETNYEILVLYILNILNMKLLFGLCGLEVSTLIHLPEDI